MKYSALLIAVITTLLIIPLPTAQGSSEQSLETGIVISKSLENEQPNWDEIVSQQLNRREAQIAEATEKARLEAVEVARKAEEARVAQVTEQARKARYAAPRVVKKTIVQAVSYGNSYARGQCTFYVASQKSVPSNWGNAREWLANARASGWATGSEPRVGAIAWTSAGRAGHVSIVRAVMGSQILVQEMNYNGVGVISSRVANASEMIYIY